MTVQNFYVRGDKSIISNVIDEFESERNRVQTAFQGVQDKFDSGGGSGGGTRIVGNDVTLTAGYFQFTVPLDAGNINRYCRIGGPLSYGRQQIHFTGNQSVLRLGACSSDGDAFTEDSDGIVVYKESSNFLARIKADRFGLTRCTDSALYFFRVDPSALYYRADPPGGAVHFRVDRVTGMMSLGHDAPVSGLDIYPDAGGVDKGFITLRELAGGLPLAAANAVALGAKDDGLGKTQLVVRFQSGAEVPLATEA